MSDCTDLHNPTYAWSELELPVWGPAFLTALSETGSVRKATAAAGIAYNTPYTHSKKHPDFDTLWQTALDVAADKLEEEARRRAVEGVEEPVYQGGQLVGHKTVYSDTLLAMLLKAAKPDKYKDRSSVQLDAKVSQSPAYDLSKLTDEQRDQLEAITRAAQVLPDNIQQ